MRKLRLVNGNSIWLNVSGTIEGYRVISVLCIAGETFLAVMPLQGKNSDVRRALPTINGHITRMVKQIVAPKNHDCLLCNSGLPATRKVMVYCKIYTSRRKATRGWCSERPPSTGVKLQLTTKDDYAARAIVEIKKRLRMGLSQFAGQTNDPLTVQAMSHAASDMIQEAMRKIELRSAEEQTARLREPRIEFPDGGVTDYFANMWTSLRANPTIKIKPSW